MALWKTGQERTMPKERAAAKEHTTGELTGDELYLARMTEMDEDSAGELGAALMGRSYRCPITGWVGMQTLPGIPDFYVVDLWTRPSVFGPIDKLSLEPYLFRPVVMSYRMWIYHWLYRERVVLPDVDENAMLKYVLAQSCIDAPVLAGRWSPVMAYVPLLLAASLTGEQTYVVTGLVLLVVLYMLTTFLNSPKAYQFIRLISLPLRLGYAGYTLATLFTIKYGTGLGVLSLAGCLMSFTCHCFDFVAGDLQQLTSASLLCTYDIVRTLPNRVFVLRRKGALLTEVKFGEAGDVAEIVSGVGKWEKSMMLMADIKGALVELRPLRKEDWREMRTKFLETGESPNFLGLDVFSRELPSAEAVEARSYALANMNQNELAMWALKQAGGGQDAPEVS